MLGEAEIQTKEDYLEMEEERERLSAQKEAKERSEDLSKYYHQRTSARVGHSGMVIILIIATLLAAMSALWIFSFTPIGREVLRTFVILIF